MEETVSELQNDNVVIQIRDRLQKEGIKLWLEPYYVEDGSCQDELRNLAATYSSTMALTTEACYTALLALQTNALENLRQRDHFKQSGLATVKLRLLNPNGSPKMVRKELLLSSLGSDFKELVSRDFDLPPQKLKIIAGGKVIQDDQNLASQGVQNGHQIMVIVLKDSATDVRAEEDRFKELEDVKADTNLLISKSDSYLNLEDQAGNSIHIPKIEREALMLAMALHEKGRAALKRDDYAMALVFLLEADNEFSRCNSQLLDSVDNYALLNLDTAWCYLCLESFSHLPEAYQRLKRCEASFRKSYGGDNFERLIAIKGSTGNEAALIMRLHLLQGIVLFHKNKRSEALEMLRKAEAELKFLKVDEGKLMSLAELGYSVAEARLGLRATQSDVNSAANFINENREQRAESRRKAKKEKILKKEQKKLGRCDDGQQYVNPSFVNMLVNMGYNREQARVALQKCNNVISGSVQYIQEHPGPSGTRSEELLGWINDLIPELVAAGFDADRARSALQENGGDIMKAAEQLLANGDVVEGNRDAENDDTESKIRKELEEKQCKEALMRLSEDISMVDDDHLDLTLEQEEVFLRKYMSLLLD